MLRKLLGRKTAFGDAHNAFLLMPDAQVPSASAIAAAFAAQADGTPYAAPSEVHLDEGPASQFTIGLLGCSVRFIDQRFPAFDRTTFEREDERLFESHRAHAFVSAHSVADKLQAVHQACGATLLIASICRLTDAQAVYWNAGDHWSGAERWTDAARDFRDHGTIPIRCWLRWLAQEGAGWTGTSGLRDLAHIPEIEILAPTLDTNSSLEELEKASLLSLSRGPLQKLGSSWTSNTGRTFRVSQAKSMAPERPRERVTFLEFDG